MLNLARFRRTTQTMARFRTRLLSTDRGSIPPSRPRNLPIQVYRRNQVQHILSRNNRSVGESLMKNGKEPQCPAIAVNPAK